MADVLTPLQRQKNMSRIRGKDTLPEMRVRRLVHGLGYRYRLHVRELPGTPDLVFRNRRKVIFVHGCFWHRHEGCRFATTPKTRTEFWLPKLEANRVRDQRNEEELRENGWNVLVLWECDLRDEVLLRHKVVDFLSDVRHTNKRT